MRGELDSAGLRYGPVAGCYGRGNVPFSSVKCWEFLAQLGDCHLLKEGYTLWSSTDTVHKG
jgi:hypothetical protein